MTDSGGNKSSSGPAYNDFRSGIIRKTEYFDLFISYKRDNGGDHGQQLAERLYKDLTKLGFKVWLDNEEIGFSRDFEKRIEEAILHSKKFACVLSPLWLESENCRYEYLKALEFEKRIVPLHYKGFRDELRQQKNDGILSESEWRRLDKPQEINFSQESFYENALNDLAAICRLKDQVTTEHTRILCEGYYWKNFDEPTGMLLRGTQLTKTKRLKQRCDGDEESPTFAALQNDFLKASEEFVNTEASRKRKVFINFDKADQDLATELDLELRINNITTWFDDFGKKDGDESAFVDAILNSETVIHITNELEEDDDLKLAFARSNSKRIVQVTSSKEALKAHQDKGEKNIYLWSEGQSLDEIITTINGDASHVSAHAALLELAYVWEADGKPENKLVHLREAEEWKEWYQKAEADGSEPPPNLKMIDFVERSIVYGQGRVRRKRMIFITTLTGIILLMLIGVLSFIAQRTANEQLRLAEEKLAKAHKKVEDENHKIDDLKTEFIETVHDFEDKQDSLNRAADSLAAKNFKVSKELASKNREFIKKEIALRKQQEESQKLMARVASDSMKLETSKEQLESSIVMLKTVSSQSDSIQDVIRAREYAYLADQAARFESRDKATELGVKAVDLFRFDPENIQNQQLFNVFYKLLPDNNIMSRNNFDEEKTASDLKKENYGSPERDTTNIVGSYTADLNRAYQKSEPKVARLSKDKTHLAVGYNDGMVKIIEKATQEVKFSKKIHSHRITDVQFNSVDDVLAVSSIDNSISIISLASDFTPNRKTEIIKQETRTRPEKLHFIGTDTLVTENHEREMTAYLTSVDELFRSAYTKEIPAEFLKHFEDKTDANYLPFSDQFVEPDSIWKSTAENFRSDYKLGVRGDSYIAFAYDDGSIKIYHAETGALIDALDAKQTLNGSDKWEISAPVAMAMNKGENHLIIAASDYEICSIPLDKTGRINRSEIILNENNTKIVHLYFIGEDQFIAVSYVDGSVWKIESASLEKTNT